jgi:hypothetical protein
MTNKFLSKGTTLQSEPGPLASVECVSPDEGIPRESGGGHLA